MATGFKRVRGRPSGASGALSDGVRRVADAFGCRAVLGFLLGRDGRLRLKEAFPPPAAVPGALDPDQARPLFEVLYADGPVQMNPAECRALPRSGAHCLAIPLKGREGPVGVLVATFDREPTVRESAALAFAGSAIAIDVEWVRRAEALERRRAASEGAARRLVSGVINSGAVCFVLDLDGRVLRWGDGASQHLGWRESDVRGRKLPVEGGADRMALEIRTGAATEEPFRVDIDVERADGTVSSLSGIGVAIPGEDESAAAVLVVCREGAATAGPNTLRQTYLASLVERELAGPLTAIKGYAELLSRPSISEDPAQRSRVAKALAHRAQDIERLLKDLAVLSGLESARGLIVEACDVSEIVADVAARVNAEHGAEVVSPIEVDGGGVVLVDRLCAAHALEGLLRCMVRAAGNEGAIRASVRVEGRSVIVALDPPGAVGADDRERSLHREASPGHVFTEAGVGFHIARLAAEAHGGALHLEPASSPVPKIEMRLPLHDGPEEAAWLVPMM
ncbi:MAG: hypothetical protein QMC94_02025 [Anaerosomatales bacterium]|nr:hypothetical protein [Anaerosomatales bacterium]